jgi:hypothetical protein
MKRTPYHFPGITVIVPEQRDMPELVAINQRALIPDDLPLESNGLTVISVIANIAIYQKRDDDFYEDSDPVKEFDPPIEIRVGYHLADVMESECRLENLKLAYWDHKEWVIISDDAHEYLILPPSTGQVAEAKINRWIGDPPIAWCK